MTITIVETDLNKRWENGRNHHPKSIELFEALSDIDMKYGNDYFCWKSGASGNSGFKSNSIQIASSRA